MTNIPVDIIVNKYDSPALTAVLEHWKEYTTDTVLLAHYELERRGFPIPAKAMKNLQVFAQNLGKQSIQECKEAFESSEFYGAYVMQTKYLDKDEGGMKYIHPHVVIQKNKKELGVILSQWETHTPDTVLVAYGELRKRKVTISASTLKSLRQFCEWYNKKDMNGCLEAFLESQGYDSFDAFTEKQIEEPQDIQSFNILTITTSVDLSYIKKYLGFIAGEAIIAIDKKADATLLEQQLENAREKAIKKVYIQAKSLGANTIMDFSVDYQTTSDSVWVVTVSGTALIVRRYILS